MKTNMLSDLLNASFSDKGPIGEFTTDDATIALPVIDGDRGSMFSHTLQKIGHITMRVGGQASFTSSVVPLLSFTIPYDAQVELARLHYDPTVVSSVLAKGLGVKDGPGVRIFKTTTRLERHHCARMARDLVRKGSFNIGEEERSAVVLLSTCYFISAFDAIGLYRDGEATTRIMSPLQANNELEDPFSQAIFASVMDDSPFKEITFNSKMKTAIAKEKKEIGLTDLVEFVRSGAKNMMRDFQLTAQSATRMLSSLKVVADILHGRLQCPVSWLSHPLFALLRSNVTFHMLTFDKPDSLWVSAASQQYAKLASSIRELSLKKTKDIDAQQAAIDVEYASDFKMRLDQLHGALQQYTSIVPYNKMVNMFDVAQVVCRDNDDIMAGLVIMAKEKKPLSLEVFTGFSVSEESGSAAKTSSLLTNAGRMDVPSIDTSLIVESVQQTLGNLDRSDVERLMELIVKESDSGLVSSLPGTSVPLITNISSFDGLEGLDDGAQSSIPYLVYLVAAGLAKEITFAPGKRLSFRRAATIASKLRHAQDQVSSQAQLSRDEIITPNPTDLLIAATLDEISARYTFEVKDGVIDLAKLVDREFVANDEFMTVFTAPVNAPKSGDRKAATSRTLKGDAIKGKAKGITKEGNVEMFYYTRRSALQVASDKQDFKEEDAKVVAPLNVRAFFDNFDNLYIGKLHTHVSLDEEIEHALNCVTLLRRLEGGAVPASKIVVSLIRSLAAPYMRTNVKAVDISGMPESPSKQDMMEYMMYSGLYSFRKLAELTEICSVDLVDRVIESAASLDNQDYLSVGEYAMSMAASRLK